MVWVKTRSGPERVVFTVIEDDLLTLANDEFFRDKAGWSELHGMFGTIRVGEGVCSVLIFVGGEPKDAPNEAHRY